MTESSTPRTVREWQAHYGIQINPTWVPVLNVLQPTQHMRTQTIYELTRAHPDAVPNVARVAAVLGHMRARGIVCHEQSSTPGGELKWRRCAERLLIPQGPSQKRARRGTGKKALAKTEQGLVSRLALHLNHAATALTAACTIAEQLSERVQQRQQLPQALADQLRALLESQDA